MYESNRLFHLLLVMATALLWAAPVETEAAHHESDKTTVEDVKKEAGETYTTLKRFTIQQRDEALAIAEQKLDRLDGRIARTEKKLEKGWQDMTLAAYRHQQETLASLRKQRNEVAEWLGGIRHSSAAAWEDVKRGFSESFDRLEKSFEKAREEFDK